MLEGFLWLVAGYQWHGINVRDHYEFWKNLSSSLLRVCGSRPPLKPGSSLCTCDWLLPGLPSTLLDLVSTWCCFDSSFLWLSAASLSSGCARHLDFRCYVLRQGLQVTQAGLIPLDPPASTSGVPAFQGDWRWDKREREREIGLNLQWVNFFCHWKMT